MPSRIGIRLAAAAVLACSIACLAPSAVYAQDDAAGGAFQSGTGAPAIVGSSGDMFAALVKVIFFLIVIIGIFLLVMKVLAKKKWSWTSGRSALRTIGGLPLGQNKSVQLVQIGTSIYVLGIGDGVSLIHKIDDPEEIAYITASIAPNSVSSGPGWQGVRDWLGAMKRSGQEPLEDDNQVAASFQDVFHSKMKHMTGRKQMIEDLMRSDEQANRKADT